MSTPSPALLADLAKKAPNSPLVKRLFAVREPPSIAASLNTLAEVLVIFGSLARGSCAEVDRAYRDGSVLRVWVRGSEPLALADARMG